MLRLVLAVALLLGTATPAAAGHPGCRPYPVTEHSPTGIVGCIVYGDGTASTWPGPGAARNDCEYPWTDCQTVAVQSLTTGLVIVVTPSMYCGCYLGDADAGNDRIIDLDPSMVAALGLDPADGLWPVHVSPVGPGGLSVTRGDASAEPALPDTSIGAPS